jgi:hypothetical protein
MIAIKAQLLLLAIGMMGGVPPTGHATAAAPCRYGSADQGLALEGISTADVARSEAEK